MLVNASEILELTKIGLREIYFQELDAPGQNYTNLFDVQTSDKALEQFFNMAGFGPVSQWDSDGQPMNWDAPIMGDRYTWTHQDYAMAWAVSHKAIRDDLYQKMGKELVSAAALSTRHTIEQTCINVFNDGFTATGYDSKVFFANDHPRLDGGASSNLLSAVALSESAIETALIQIKNAKNERGQPVVYSPQVLLIPPDLEFTAKKILGIGSTVRSVVNDTVTSGTAVVGGTVPNHLDGIIPQVIVSPYLTATGKYFIGCAPNQRFTKFFWREKPTYDAWKDFETKGIANSVNFAFSVGYTNYKGWFGGGT